MRRLSLIMATATIVALTNCSDPSNPGNGGCCDPPIGDDSLDLTTITTGLHQPTFLLSPPGDTGRLFVLEQNGYVRVIQHGVLLPTPFLDVHTLVTGGSEQGLLGMAFYPDYATSGRFIISYTSPIGTEDGGTSVIARYTVSADSNVANPTPQHELLRFDQPYSNHNGGMIAFGPDGYLYLGFGDGGSGGDPQGHGQDRTDLLGSMLRLDVSGDGDYSIPPSNPYATSATFRHELWNYGLRNPWRFSFDRSTHQLYIGDVGQELTEEIDVAAAADAGGENYGWNAVEGDHCYTGGCNLSLYVPPVFTYNHNAGCAIIGGYVYRGTDLTDMAGTYFFGDACSGWVHSIRYNNGTVSDFKTWPNLGGHGGIQSFGEDARGELYVLTADGGVYKIVKSE